MCGPIKIWKFTVYIAGGVFSILGVVLMALSIWISQKEFAKATDLDGLLLGFGVAFGVVILIMGLVGWAAVKCESRCLICLFLVFMLVITLAFLIVWVVAEVLQSNLHNNLIDSKENDIKDICDGKYGSNWLENIQRVYPKTICNSEDTPQYTVTQCGIYGTDHICETKTNINDCSMDEKILIYKNNEPPKIYMDLAKYLEKEQGCAGICNKCPHPMYSDCNSDKELPTCEKKLADLINGMHLIVHT